MPAPAIALAVVIGAVALARSKKSGGKLDPFDENLIEWEDGRPRPAVGETKEATGPDGTITNVTNDGAGLIVEASNGAPPPSAPPSQSQTSSPNAPIGGELAPSGTKECVPNAGGGMTCATTETTIATAPPVTPIQQAKALYYNTTGLSPTSSDRLLQTEGGKVGAIW